MPSFRAVSRRATTTAWAVGSFDSLDAVMGPGDHRLVDDGDRGDRALARGPIALRASASASPMKSS